MDGEVSEIKRILNCVFVFKLGEMFQHVSGLIGKIQ